MATYQATPGTGIPTQPVHRPGLVTFAAIVTFIVAGIQGIVAINEFANSTLLFTAAGHTYNLWNGHMFWWGVIDATVAVVAFFAALDMLRGGAFGLVMGLFGATISALRWFFYIPATPWLALAIIAIDVLVIYGLTSSGKFFGSVNEY